MFYYNAGYENRRHVEHMKKLGIDLAQVSRFRLFTTDKTHPFLTRNFSKRELAYCFAFADPSPHLAGTFAAKEAVHKAFAGRYPVSEIEILRRKDGSPEARRGRAKLAVSVSISHEDTMAVAVALQD